MVATAMTSEEFLDRVVELYVKFPYVTVDDDRLVGHEDLSDEVLDNHGSTTDIGSAVRLATQDEPELAMALAFAMGNEYFEFYWHLSEFLTPKCEPSDLLLPIGISVKRAAKVKATLPHMDDAPDWVGGTTLELAQWALTNVCSAVHHRLKRPLGIGQSGQQDGEGVFFSREAARVAARQNR